MTVRLLEQAPTQMADGAVCWAKLVVPLVVHSANKVRLRAAAALELGMPLLLEKQPEVAAIVEPMMSSVSVMRMYTAAFFCCAYIYICTLYCSASSRCSSLKCRSCLPLRMRRIC